MVNTKEDTATSLHAQYVKPQDAAVALRAQYGFGDDAQREQLDAILAGEAELVKGGVNSATAEAETQIEAGKRVVHLAGYREGMSPEEQLRLAITLGHEAYRDGVVGTSAEQKAETDSAVIGHTGMMTRMFEDKS